MEEHYIDINWDFDPLVDMDLTRFKERMSVIRVKDINPKFLNKLRDAELVLLKSLVFHAWPGFTGPAHIDGVVSDSSLPWASRCNINWVDVPTTLTEWYSVTDESKTPLTKSATMVGTPFINYDTVTKTVIKSAYLQGWHLFEAGVPHKVLNSSAQHRWCISFVVFDNSQQMIPSVLAVQKRLQNL